MPRDNWRIVLRDFLKMFSICLVVWGIVDFQGSTTDLPRSQ